MSLKQHDRVRLTLTNDSIYSGDIVQINETRMKITNIYDERSQSLISGGGGQMIFYRNEVKTAYRVPTTNEQIIAPAISNDDDDEKEIISCWPAVDNNDAAAKLPNDLMIELTEMTVNHIYVKSLLSTNDNDDYSRAMNRLENCETLSVVGLGNCTDHTLPLSLLVLSTYDQVYIFDMYRMANCRNDNKVGTDHGSNSDFMSRLKSIFESHEITKIIHGGKALVHCLANTYGINLENIFDTQIAHHVITKENNKKNLLHCLSYHFNLSSNVLAAPLDEMMDDNLWTIRPVFLYDRIAASHLVVYLWKLKQHLQNVMLKDLAEETDTAYREYCSKSEFHIHLEHNNIDPKSYQTN